MSNIKSKTECISKYCTFNKKIDDKYSDYCGKHQLEGFKKEADDNGIKLCREYIRGCKNILPDDYKKKTCEECLQKNRLEDTKRLKSRSNISNEFNNSIFNEIIEYISNTTEIKHTIPNDKNYRTIINKIMKQINNDLMKNVYEYVLSFEIECHSCSKDNCRHPLSEFIGINSQICLKCAQCREQDKKADDKRKYRKRNWTTELENNPERAKKKKEWHDNNYEKVAKYWMDYRMRTIDEIGIDEYWKQNADYAKQYRNKLKQDNPEKYEEQKLLIKSDLENKLKYYKHRANDHNIKWLIDDEYAKLLFGQLCYYCNEIDIETNINGIDRKYSNENYTKENCVSCCSMCNYIKNDTNIDRYMKKIKHILTQFIFLIDKQYYFFDAFGNHTGGDYKSYKLRAISKNIDFELTKDQLIAIQSLNCYICGKESDSLHLNGVDRINNEIGYIYENCLPCCTECNILKNCYYINDVILKLYKTYCNHNKITNIYSEKYIIFTTDFVINNKIRTMHKFLKMYPIGIDYKNKKSKITKKSIDQTIARPKKLTRQQKIEKNTIRKEEKKKVLYEKIHNDDYKKEKALMLKNNKKK